MKRSASTMGGALDCSHTLASEDLDDQGVFTLSTPSGERTVHHTPVGLETDTDAWTSLQLDRNDAVQGGHIVQPIMRISNVGAEDVVLETTNSCVSIGGPPMQLRIVYDNRWDAPCVDVEERRSIDAGEHIDYTGPGGALLTLKGARCRAVVTSLSPAQITSP